MIQPAAPDLITVNIDGREIAVPKGTNVIEAALRARRSTCRTTATTPS